MADAGALDGETARIHAYGAAHSSLVRVEALLANIPTYAYLHKQHAALAPRMAAVIKEMKTEGLVEAYRQQAMRAMGWIR